MYICFGAIVDTEEIKEQNLKVLKRYSAAAAAAEKFETRKHREKERKEVK